MFHAQPDLLRNFYDLTAIYFVCSFVLLARELFTNTYEREFSIEGLTQDENKRETPMRTLHSDETI